LKRRKRRTPVTPEKYSRLATFPAETNGLQITTNLPYAKHFLE